MPVRPSRGVASWGPLFAAAVAASLATAVPAAAQIGAGQSSAADATGMDAGNHDGRMAGLAEGGDRGRDQVLVDTFWRAFRRGLTDADAGTTALARAQALEAGRAQGVMDGFAAGAIRGAASATAPGETNAAGPPILPAPAAPDMLPAAHDSASCRPPAHVMLELRSGRELELDPAQLDSAPPLGLEIPEPTLPRLSTLRDRAARLGYIGVQVDEWVTWYGTGFHDSYHEAFAQQREEVPREKRDEMEQQGLALGRQEGARRRACEVWREAWPNGYRSGEAEGFSNGYGHAFADASARLGREPVVRVESARLADGGGDGVLEPGEDVALELTARNAGRDTDGAAVRWRGLHGLRGTGTAGGPLATGRSEASRTVLGTVPPDSPAGSSIVVELHPAGGDQQRLVARVGRPVVIDGATGRLDARDGHLVIIAAVNVRSGSSRDVPSGLEVASAGTATAVGPLQPGEGRTVEVAIPAEPSALAGTASTRVELRDASGTSWGTWLVDVQTPMARSVELAGRSDVAAAVAPLRDRLLREWDAAQADPEVDVRRASSELSQYARALAAVPADVRGVLEAGVTSAVRARAASAEAPRALRRAVNAVLRR